MVRIAIAGGTGGVGRTLVDEFSKGGEHVVFVLSRKSKLPFEASANVQCLTVPYDNIDALAQTLESNGIHTIISTLNPPTSEVHAAQDNLIRAAAQSGTVKRFIPSEWGIDCEYDDEHLPLPPPWKDVKRESTTELEKHPDLEYTLVFNGYFLDYFGMPHCQSYMIPETPYIDIAARKAAIPGSGNDKVVFTYTKDVARIIRKMVESEEKWPRKTHIVGDSITLNEILETTEKIRGTKFDVVHDSLEDLRAGKISEIPAYASLYNIVPKEFFLGMMAALGVAMITGVFSFEGDLVNQKYPDIRLANVRGFIKEHWEGK